MVTEMRHKQTEEFCMDVNELPSIKQNIRQLKKEKEEILASSRDSDKLKQIRRRIKLLKRQTRELSKQKKKLAAPAAPQAAAG